jgi:uncharacterized protein GlcG (DUF336 family)
MRELTLVEVETLLREGIAYAQSQGRPSSMAVVDFGGHLRGGLRPEKGRIANMTIAEKKAWAVRLRPAAHRRAHLHGRRWLPDLRRGG